MTTVTRSCVELALPAALLQRVARGKTFSCFDSRGTVVDMSGAVQLLEVRQWLTDAVSEALAPLSAHQHATAMRHMDRAVDAAVASLEGLPAVRAARAIAWWLHDLISAGEIDLWAGSAADQAITRLLSWCGETMDIMNPGEADRLDAAAQKSARRIAATLAAQGYFGAGRTLQQLAPDLHLGGEK